MDYGKYEVTMTYEVIGKLPDGTIFQVQKQIVCLSNKEANEKIAEWNRIAAITQIVKYSYRRLG